ncbi:MAG: 6-phosphofructokinase [Acidobacteria bacterium RIFCSPLOWO2_12_FULL_67_14]|nr:MAG: 6-phosphofructokinase [Acidobacteria bacterium RIFCSPLOWO2_02_FULL_67_21]OFW40899.1 MAG: 6-phosphofructokinase [Acidobacteria bacterium RIFCSPLOWO2_12_FULL_67_14]
MPTLKKIGVLTGGGDAPGLNAVIRAVVKAGCNAGLEVVGLEDSFDGLIYPEKARPLTPRDVTGILRLGGTILGTVNRGNPFLEPITTPEGTFDYAARVIEMFHRTKLDALVCIGGDGTLAISYEFHRKGMPLVGVPKTIDNDIAGTNSSFGFDTAVSFATEAIDRLHTTAEAHRRIMVVEVMGRYAGWIALHGGVAGGADVILIPEIPYDLEKVATCIRDRDEWGARFSIVVVAEGARARGGQVSLIQQARGAQPERLGGAGMQVARELEDRTGKETRYVVLGHLQRGGAPTAFDRTLATRFGGKAVELLLQGQFGVMVANHPPDIVPVPLGDVVGKLRTVPLDYDLVHTARALGVSFGD